MLRINRIFGSAISKLLPILFLIGLSSFPFGQTPEKKLTLQQCIQIALEKSPYAVRVTGEHLKANYDVFNSLSTVLPQLQFSSGYAVNSGEDQINTFGAQTIFTDNDQLNLELTISQSVVDIPSWVQLKQAYTAADAAEINLRGARADLVFNVKQAFFELVQVYRNVSVTQASVDQSLEQVAVAEERFRLGGISRPEFLRVQVGLSQLSVELINARSNVENGRRNLANYLGISYQLQIDTTLEFPDTMVSFSSEDSLVKLTLQRNPSFLTSKLTYEIEKSSEFSLKLQKVPTLSGSYSYGYSSSDPFSDWSENDFWTIGIQLTWPIFEGLRWYGQLKGAQVQTTTAKADMEIARNSAIEEMHQAFSNLMSNRQSLSIVNALLEQAGEEFRLRKEQYRLGAVSTLELLTSQVSFNEAQQQAIQIITGYYLAYAQILRLLGEW